MAAGKLGGGHGSAVGWVVKQTGDLGGDAKREALVVSCVRRKASDAPSFHHHPGDEEGRIKGSSKAQG